MWHFVDCAVVNSYILYKLKKLPPITLKDFTRKVVDGLLAERLVEKLDLLPHHTNLFVLLVVNVQTAAPRQIQCDLIGHVIFIKLRCALGKAKTVSKNITAITIKKDD
ncbi:hypothetical protein HUJ04_003371 [Dendroctonus ponderosae]|nr:hypothetical protein HUJ04_003371 [Dendroctonus ponderosae]